MLVCIFTDYHWTYAKPTLIGNQPLVAAVHFVTIIVVLSLDCRSDVFVVMLRYLNELSFYYIAAENSQVTYHQMYGIWGPFL